MDSLRRSTINASIHPSEVLRYKCIPWKPTRRLCGVGDRDAGSVQLGVDYCDGCDDSDHVFNLDAMRTVLDRASG